MKCKPEQLCEIISPYCPENRGHFVTTRCLNELASFNLGEPVWRVDSPAPLRAYGITPPLYVRTGCIHDRFLRPIDSPPAGAVDARDVLVKQPQGEPA